MSVECNGKKGQVHLLNVDIIMFTETVYRKAWLWLLLPLTPLIIIINDINLFEILALFCR
jgi:hypothetical protein